MQKDVEKMTTNTARHGAFGVGERFAKPKLPDSAAVSHLNTHAFLLTCLSYVPCAYLFTIPLSSAGA